MADGNEARIRPSHDCLNRARRAAMTDEAYWDDVARSLIGGTTWAEEGLPPEEESINLDPCPECGSMVACGYDSEGRPMIHVIEEDE